MVPHWLAAASALLDDMHTRLVVCTPWPHVTEHGVLVLTQLYVSRDCTVVDGVAVDGSGVAQGERSHSSESAGFGSVQLPSATTPPTTLVAFNEVP